MKASLESVRAAKETFKRLFPDTQSPGITGNSNDGYKLAVRVQTQEEADTIPKEVDGVPVLCRVVGAIRKL